MERPLSTSRLFPERGLVTLVDRMVKSAFGSEYDSWDAIRGKNNPAFSQGRQV